MRFRLKRIATLLLGVMGFVVIFPALLNTLRNRERQTASAYTVPGPGLPHNGSKKHSVLDKHDLLGHDNKVNTIDADDQNIHQDDNQQIRELIKKAELKVERTAEKVQRVVIQERTGDGDLKSGDRGGSDIVVYDWSKDIRPYYFRGYHVPDDMLALNPPHYLSNYKNPCFYVLDPGGYVHVSGVKARVTCMPYFHVIGVDKSGTTDLWARLTRHKQVVRNAGVGGKETHWWSWRRFGFDIWVRNAAVRHFDWYISHFDTAARQITDDVETRGNATYHPMITGEGSPTVSWDLTGWDKLPQNENRTADTALLTPHCLHHLTPRAKLILLLRNPVDRLYSDYLFLDRFKAVHNVSARLFHEAVVQSIAIYRECVHTHHSIHACLYNKTLHMIMPVRVMVGLYSVWLREWLKVFPRQQMLILRTEDYANDTASHMARVFQFLDLSELGKEELNKVAAQDRVFQRSKSEKAVGDMLPDTRNLLTKFFHPFNTQLADLLQDKRYLWL